MEAITEFVGTVNGIVWGIPMLILILGAGLFLTIGLRFLSIMKIPFGFSLLWKGRIPGDDAGDITPFNALMTSLSATIGTGNIAGVATAIFLGGPGAVFWMWMTALVGMATKYAEAVCAVRFRETDENGNFVGGPMYYIQNGMGANWRWLAITFALFAGIAGFGIGNMVQSNSIADALNTNFGIPHLTGSSALVGACFLAVSSGFPVAGRLVPLMAALYILASLVVLVINAGAIPHALGLIPMPPGSARRSAWSRCVLAVIVPPRPGSRASSPCSAPLSTPSSSVALPRWRSCRPVCLGGPIIALSLAIFAFTTIIG